MMSNSLPEKQTEGIRLQKVLAAAGLGSRRACEELIAAGRVSVDGKVVRGQGMRVDPQTAVVSVDGARVNVREDLVYLALNKPRGVLSTMSDPEGRPTVGTTSPSAPSGCFTSAGSTPRPKGFSSSRTTVSWRTA